MSRHSPFSEYELTAENERPSFFYSLGSQEAVPAAVLEYQPPAWGLLSCLGTFGWRWRVESQCWRSHCSMKAAVIPSFRKSPNEQIAKTVALQGTTPL